MTFAIAIARNHRRLRVAAASEEEAEGGLKAGVGKQKLRATRNFTVLGKWFGCLGVVFLWVLFTFIGRVHKTRTCSLFGDPLKGNQARDCCFSLFFSFGGRIFWGQSVSGPALGPPAIGARPLTPLIGRVSPKIDCRKKGTCFLPLYWRTCCFSFLGGSQPFP